MKPMTAADVPEAASGGGIFKVGSLVYTRRSLFVLFAWLLWGDVCFTIMESVPGLIPLQLKALDAPNWVMSLIISTLPNLLNATVCPWVSYQSDRHRGPRGRRIPFILYTAPFLAAALILIGFSAPLGAWIQASILPGLSPSAVTIGCIGVFSTLFAFFNMFVASVFWYLLNDVVPADPAMYTSTIGPYTMPVGASVGRYLPRFSHRRRMNCSFYDGHVAGLSLQDMVGDGSTNNLWYGFR